MVEGAAIAAALNSLTRKTKVHNVVQFTARDAGLVLYNSTHSPAALEAAFAPLQSAVLQAQARHTSAPAAPLNKYDLLKQIAELRDAGVLTEDEFQQQKAEILSN
jgi:hypothetical protein